MNRISHVFTIEIKLLSLILECADLKQVLRLRPNIDVGNRISTCYGKDPHSH